jgi:hypothetical protein
MVDPEIAENTVPATTATTARRPGTCRMRRSTPSMTFTGEPGVEQHFAHQDEERNGRERKARHRADAVPRQLHQARLAAEEEHRAEQVDHQEGERHRQPEEEQQGRASEHQPCGCVP